ncbi:MAG: ferritin-like domain-containing protein [Pseudomonadota bacterium]
MTQSSTGWHEPVEVIKPQTRDRHRAIVSLMEEFEAVDWYDQRVDATADEELRAILAHNRDEEKEHAAILLEWLRRRDPAFERHLRDWLFTDAPILERAADAENAAATGALGDGSLGIGDLRERRT